MMNPGRLDPHRFLSPSEAPFHHVTSEDSPTLATDVMIHHGKCEHFVSTAWPIGNCDYRMGHLNLGVLFLQRPFHGQETPVTCSLGMPASISGGFR